MKTLQLCGPGVMELSEMPKPEPDSAEELLQVAAVGICGSDLHWFQEGGIGDSELSRPLILGHEFGATIRGGERDGMRVAVDPSIVCGRCEYCEEGNPNFCSRIQFAGHEETDGALREFMTWPSRFCFPVPDEIGDAETALLEPLGVAIHSLDLARLSLARDVGVFGCGPIGLMIIQLLRRQGADSIVASEPLAHRREAALSQGASCVEGTGKSLLERIRRDYPEGLDVVFEVAGDDLAVQNAAEAAKPGGTLILVGIPAGERTTFPASAARRKGLTVRWVRRMKHVYPRAIRLALSGAVDLSGLVTHRYALEDYEEAFTRAARREGLKTVIEPRRSL